MEDPDYNLPEGKKEEKELTKFRQTPTTMIKIFRKWRALYEQYNGKINSGFKSGLRYASHLVNLHSRLQVLHFE